MSATGRSDVRKADDAYTTPAWCVEALAKGAFVPGSGIPYRSSDWLEPCAGDGAIMRALSGAALCVRLCVRWTAVELRDLSAAGPIFGGIPGLDDSRLHTGTDFLTFKTSRKYDIAITNPPYSLALEMIQAAFRVAGHVIMLLRVNFLASEARHPWLSRNMPNVYVLPNRPIFHGTHGDATEYAWMHWDTSLENQATSGKVSLLPLTPKSRRKPAPMIIG